MEEKGTAEDNIRYWDHHVRLCFYEMEDSISLEDLYQAFKARMEREAKEDNDFPLGQACDLSGEGHCTACE